MEGSYPNAISNETTLQVTGTNIGGRYRPGQKAAAAVVWQLMPCLGIHKIEKNTTIAL